MRLRWDAGPAVVRADRGRLAQAFSNLLANAVEHGTGRVEVRGSRAGVAGARRDVQRRGSRRGRGLGIAARAVEEAGGRARDRARGGRHDGGGRAAAGGRAVNARTPQRRAAVLLSLALACGGLAASEVGSRVREVEARVGAPVPVVVAARDAGGRPRAEARRRRRPRGPRALRAAGRAGRGRRGGGRGAVSAPLARGAYLTAAALGGAGAPRRLGRGAAQGRAGGGGRRDRRRSARGGRRSGRARGRAGVHRAARGPGAQLPGARGRGGARPGRRRGGRRPRRTPRTTAPAASATATLRVTLRQAVYLTAAQNFAREVRLLPRPAGDRSRAGRAAVSAGGL